jgi:glutamine amidotransferase
MCRVFGFKSVISSQVHNSLISAENALAEQSTEHPHGWGVAYYVAGSPHIIKNVDSAVEDKIFARVSGVVSSHTVVAHIRKATLGEHSIVNTHPFQYGPWVFAHNGHIHEFEKYREQLLALVSPGLKRFILGDTDSEIIFYIILTKYFETKSLTDKVSVDEMAKIVRSALSEITKIIGPMATEDTPCLKNNYLSFVITNGDLILAHNGGKKVFYSTYKKKCSDRDTCSSFSDVCEAPSKTGFVNHMIFSSEPLSGENIWIEMNIGQIIGVDNHMQLFID